MAEETTKTITGAAFRSGATVALGMLFVLSLVAYGKSGHRSRSKKKPKPVALLTGCTVNSNNQPNCAIPAGWTTVDVQGFDKGTFNSNESTGFAGNGPETINCTIGHAGSCSLDALQQASFHGQGLEISGSSVNSRVVYVSYWMNVQNANPGYGQGYNNWFRFARGLSSNPFELVGDFTSPNQACFVACLTGDAVWFGQSATRTPGPFGQYGSYITYTPGVWKQYEFYFKANTPDSGSTIYTDGDFEYYVDGVNMLSCTAGNNCPHNSNFNPGNFNGSEDFTQADVYVGGDWGVDAEWQDLAHTICATSASNDLSNTSMNIDTCQCPNQCPPNGKVPHFHIYYDDVIVMKK